MQTTIPTTELEAVNVMLEVLGEAPVNSLTDVEALDATEALRLLKATTRTLLTRGWYINTECRSFVPTVVGHVLLPAEVLYATPDPDEPLKHLIQRGQRMYDPSANTYKIKAASVSLQITTALDFEDLPQPFREHITIKAASTFQTRQLGSPTLDSFTTQEVERTRRELVRLHSRHLNRNRRRGSQGGVRLFGRLQ